MNILNELEIALLDDPNNSIEYVDKIIKLLKENMEESYRDGYNDCLLDFEDLGVTIRR